MAIPGSNYDAMGAVEGKLRAKRQALIDTPPDSPLRCRRCGMVTPLDGEKHLCARCRKQLARLKSTAERDAEHAREQKARAKGRTY